MQKKYNHFSFRKITADDLPLLHSWFNEPHVKEWWPVLSKDEFLDKFLERIRSKDTFAYLIFLDNTPIGYIQYYYIDRSIEKAGKWLPELPKNTVGTDQFIGDPGCVGKGYGTLFMKEFINYLTQKLEPHITTIIVDPDPTNHAAIRCYEKVGFKSQGVFAAPSGYEYLLMRYDVKK